MGKHAGFEKLVADAKKRITEISPQDAAAKSQSGEAVIVDVREKDEWDEEHIPNATHLSRGTIELDGAARRELQRRVRATTVAVRVRLSGNVMKWSEALVTLNWRSVMPATMRPAANARICR